MKVYWEIIKHYKKFLIISPLLVIGFVFCETAQPTLMATIIDDGVLKRDMSVVLNTGLIMVLLSVIAITLSIANLYCSTKTSIGFSTDLRSRMFTKVQNFSFAEIDLFNPASLITRMTNDTVVLQQVLMRSMMLLFRAPLMMLLAFIFVTRINMQIAWLIALAIPVLGTGIFLLLRKGYPLFILVQQKLDNLNSIVRENLINIRVVKSFVREDHEKVKFNRSNNDYKSTSINALNIVITVMPLMQLVMNTLIICILWIGGSTGLLIGELISLINYSMQILMALMLVSMTIMMLARASASSERILEVMDKESSIQNTVQSELHSYQVTRGEIVFKEVCFRYDKSSENCVLKDINLHIYPGETIAIAGATGSAKTTLLQLIPRLYDATEGKVLIDGINVKDYKLEDLRKSVGMVLQKNELFSGTILYNLQWGNENASMEEVEKAAKIAQAHEFIMSFPAGYDTLLEQGGVNLSGGQKQRLCIARALLRQPKILILDDSTSALDTETERKIRHNLKSVDEGITVLVVTQRLSSMQDADRIIILDDGMIEAIGTSQELMEKSAIYQEIYNSQQVILE